MKKIPENRRNFCLLIIGIFFSVTQQANAACQAGSYATLTAPLHFVTYDPATRIVTYGAVNGSVAKKAKLLSDCVSFTTYTIKDSKSLPYPDGTQILVSGKTLYSTVPSTSKAIYLTVTNGSIDGSFSATGMQTGINSDSVTFYKDSTQVMRVKQPWK